MKGLLFQSFFHILKITVTRAAGNLVILQDTIQNNREFADCIFAELKIATPQTWATGLVTGISWGAVASR